MARKAGNVFMEVLKEFGVLGLLGRKKSKTKRIVKIFHQALSYMKKTSTSLTFLKSISTVASFKPKCLVMLY